MRSSTWWVAATVLMVDSSKSLPPRRKPTTSKTWVYRLSKMHKCTCCVASDRNRPTSLVGAVNAASPRPPLRCGTTVRLPSLRY
jgi:hypothetical protein